MHVRVNSIRVVRRTVGREEIGRCRNKHGDGDGPSRGNKAAGLGGCDGFVQVAEGQCVCWQSGAEKWNLLVTGQQIRLMH